MSDLYIHHHLKPTTIQHENLADLARHLITRSPLLRTYDKLVFSEDERERAPLPPQAVVEGRKMPAMMPLAHGPLAGIPARPGESWSDYGARTMLMQYGSLLEQWVQRPHWRWTDPTAVGVGFRIAYALSYGVPSNWEAISSGNATSDYPYSYYILERIGLEGWREFEGSVEWQMVEPQITKVAIPRLRGG